MHRKELLISNMKCAEMELNLKNSNGSQTSASSFRHLFVSPSLHECFERLLRKISEKDEGAGAEKGTPEKSVHHGKSESVNPVKERKLYAARLRVVPVCGICGGMFKDRLRQHGSTSFGGARVSAWTSACLCLHTRETLDCFRTPLSRTARSH